jgi:hypothetical protein
MSTIRFGRELELAVAFAVARTLAHRWDHGIVEAVEAS